MRETAVMPPSDLDHIGQNLLARERTLPRITDRLGRITAELTHEEFLRLLRAMLSAHPEGRGGVRQPPGS